MMSTAVPENIALVRKRFTALCVEVAPSRLKLERETHAPGEFDDLAGDSRCMLVDVTGSSLFLATPPLLFECRGTLHAVGDFAIRIDPKSRAITCMGSVMRSTVNGSGAWHPHVLQSGQPCFGEAGRTKLSHWFADGMLAHVALYVIEFLCLARGESDYAPARAWRQANEEEITAWKARHPGVSSCSRLTNSIRPPSTSSGSAPEAPRRRWFSRS